MTDGARARTIERMIHAALRGPLGEVTRARILEELERQRGNTQKTARALQIGIRSLERMIRRFDLRPALERIRRGPKAA